MRPLLLAIALVLASGSTGCAGRALRGTLPPLAIRMPEGAPPESFARMIHAATALHYRVEFADLESGVFGMRARGRPRRGQPAVTFVVQCYADGRATLTAVGGRPVGTDYRVRVSEDVRREAVRLAQALEDRAPR